MKHSEKKEGTLTPPATDILEMDDGFHVIMDMPGVSADDIVIDIEESELTISGENSYVEPNNSLRRLHIEFTPRRYRRTFSLSDLVDHDNVDADLKDGVLRLYLPKAEAMKPRRIPIS
ncbi:MAG: Hsp20/alpha crystallin family protein [Deltaproteobacteria bacterium]|jgi:HSP20 family molecular chaperone IbpA|nr:Hsp20/alpha crystallin family protein [Deltaproteobacteria bacterium]